MISPWWIHIDYSW